jgi:hypothetical protein
MASLFSIIMVVLTSCGTPTTSSSIYMQPSEIREPQIGAPYSEIVYQEVQTDNCDGTNKTTTIARSLVQEQTTFYEINVEAGGLIRGTPIPGILEAELEAKIKSALGSRVGNTFTQTISTVLETPEGQSLKHTISWNETKVKGVIDVVYSDGTARINFEKVIAIELAGRTSEPLECTGQSTIVPITITPSNNEVQNPTPTLKQGPRPTSEPITNSTVLIGLWEYKKTRAPMPSPASLNQIILANGDINTSGTCHIKAFNPGEQVQGLGEGTFQLWLISGTSDYINMTLTNIQQGAAADAGGSCPLLP